MSTRSAVSARRSVIGALGRETVVAQRVVQLGLVVALALGQALDDEHARQTELAARERPWPRGGDGDAPRRHDAAADLLARLGVDDRDRVAQDHARAEHRARADASAA